MNKTEIVFSYAGDLWSVNRQGGVAMRLTAGAGNESSAVLSPDGKRMAYQPLDGGQFATDTNNFVSWKRYRGGRASYIWIVNFADLSTQKIPRTDSNDFSPLWIGDKVYFLSDRNGPVTLFRY